MKGWIIFKHAVLMFWDNREIALRIFGFALSTFASFVLGMLNASLLTTLYGHYIENREI